MSPHPGLEAGDLGRDVPAEELAVLPLRTRQGVGEHVVLGRVEHVAEELVGASTTPSREMKEYALNLGIGRPPELGYLRARLTASVGTRWCYERCPSISVTTARA
jgi:hypothetical protein